MSFMQNVKTFFGDSFEGHKQRLKKLVLAAPFWVLLIGFAMTATGVGRYIYLTDCRVDQKMAVYWSAGSGTSFRQMSVYGRGLRPSGETSAPVYIDAQTSLKRSDITIIRSSLQSAADAGRAVSSKSGDSATRLSGWEDCFSSFLQATLTVVIDDASAQVVSASSDAEIVAVEGNFTVFHPFEYLSGGFLPETVEDSRQIVINDVLAWKFFRSYDVVGSKLNLWGGEFTIIGVVKEAGDSIAKSTGTDEPRAYVYFSTMEAIAPVSTVTSEEGRESSTTTRPDIAVLCYEAMLPEIVKGVAKTDMVTALPSYTASDPGFYVVSNTGRFNIYNVYKYMWPIGQTSSMLSGYELPYWEKAAALTTQHLFADEILVAGGVVLLLSGTVMAILRHRKMSLKRNITPET